MEEPETEGGQAMAANGAHHGVSELCLDLPRLKLVATPVQRLVGSFPATYLGLGHNAADNLKLRKRLGKPGAPFGGIGLFDPQSVEGPAEELKEAVEEGEGGVPELTAELVRRTKLEEFRRCTEGAPSVYVWCLQPLFSTQDRAVAAEVLLRARNGSDAAPFEDLQAIMDPSAPSDVKQVYGEWKASEIVDFTLKALRENKILRKLAFISTNLRPLDLNPEGLIFTGVLRRLQALPAADRELLLALVLIEITEDQQHPDDIVSHVEAWQKLGFRFASDDTIGEIAAKALGAQEQNFNTLTKLTSLLRSFWLVKVDMGWAGHLLFLCHPCVLSRPALRAEILRYARDEDEVHIAAGSGLRKLEAKHSELLSEFAQWANEMIALGKRICIELTVRQEDENCALALGRLAEMGLEIFGKDQAYFWFQGGPCGAKAFLPQQLAEAATVHQVD